MKSIPLHTPAFDKRFYGYSEELNRIWGDLESDRDVALLGPRRSGKTSVLRKISDNASEHGFAATYLDVLAVRNPRDFIAYLFRSARALPSAEGAMGNAERKLKSMQGVSDARILPSGLKLVFESGANNESWDWKGAGEILLESLVISDQKILFVIDEFGYFLHQLSDEDVVELVTWFRSVRGKISNSDRVRWLVSLDRAAEHRLRAVSARYSFEDLAHVELQPWPQRTANDYLYIILNEIGMSANSEIRDQIIDELGCAYPYFINAFVDSLQKRARTNEAEITTELIQKSIAELANERSNYFFGMNQLVLAQVSKDKVPAVENVLAVLSQSSSEMTIQELFGRLNPEIKAALKPQSLSEILEVLASEDIALLNNGVVRLRPGIVQKFFKNRYAWLTAATSEPRATDTGSPTTS